MSSLPSIRDAFLITSKVRMTNAKILLKGGVMPVKATEYASGYDLVVNEDVVLKGGRQVVDLGFAIELPAGYEAQIRPRSGFSCKGMEVRYCIKNQDGKWVWNDNSYRLDADVLFGTVDEDYRGNVGAIVDVHQKIGVNERFVIKKGTRIAQMVIAARTDVGLEEAEELDMDKDRNGGYGHTGAMVADAGKNAADKGKKKGRTKK